MATESGANVPFSPSSNSAESFIGCFISLISKSDIRYEGVLYFLNVHDSTIGLENVRSYGTEGRRKDGQQVPPSDKIYEYILFRGNDIKNLQIKSPPTSSKSEEQIFSDPAIIQSQQHSESLSSSVASVGGRSLIESIQRQDVPAISSNAFSAGLPSHQSVTHLGPSYSSAATQVASHPSFSTAMHWQRPSGISSSGSHSLLQSSSLYSPLPATSLAGQNQMQNGEARVHTKGGWTGLSEYGLPVSSAMTSSLVNLTHTPSLTALTNSASLDIPPLLSKTPVTYSAPTTFDGLNMPRFSSPLQDVYSNGAQISRNIYPDPRPIHPQHSVHHSAPSFVDSTSGPLPTAPSLLTPDQFAHPREQLFSLTQNLNPNQKDMGSLTLSSSGSSALMLSPFSQAPLLPLPKSVQKPQYTAPQYTEEFDFEAMNEKFKKDEVWGSLGKATTKMEGGEDNASVTLGDRECHRMIPNPQSAAYRKDDFFDTISCNSLTRGSWNGQNHFSERMKMDTETFGNFQQRPNFSNGAGRGENFRGSYNWGRGENFRGSYNWGRGYGYNGRGRGPNFPF